MTLHYLVTGHTKFSPDRMFGWASVLLMTCDLFSAEDIEEAIKQAKSKSYNAVLCDKKMFKNWIPYINQHYTKIEGIAGWHVIEVQKIKNSIKTQAKMSSKDTNWTTIEHVQSKKLAPFILREIEGKLLPEKLYKNLTEIISDIPDPKKQQRLKTYINKYKPPSKTKTKSK